MRQTALRVVMPSTQKNIERLDCSPKRHKRRTANGTICHESFCAISFVNSAARTTRVAL